MCSWKGKIQLPKLEKTRFVFWFTLSSTSYEDSNLPVSPVKSPNFFDVNNTAIKDSDRVTSQSVHPKNTILICSERFVFILSKFQIDVVWQRKTAPASQRTKKRLKLVAHQAPCNTLPRWPACSLHYEEITEQMDSPDPNGDLRYSVHYPLVIFTHQNRLNKHQMPNTIEPSCRQNLKSKNSHTKAQLWEGTAEVSDSAAIIACLRSIKLRLFNRRRLFMNFFRDGFWTGRGSFRNATKHAVILSLLSLRLAS